MSESSLRISTATAGMPPSSRPRRRRRTGWVLAAVAAVGAVGGGAVWIANSGEKGGESLTTALVERGPMLVSVTETGEVTAEEREVITNTARWSVVIKELAEEGKIVKPGDLIIHMECKELDDAMLDQALDVDTADRAYQTAATRLIVARKTMANKVSKAEQAVTDAQDDLKKYVEGEWPVQLAETQSKILLADEELQLARHTLKTMLEINKDPELGQPYSDSEIRNEQLKVTRLELNLKKAQDEKAILEDYTHKRTVRDKETAVKDAQLDLETARLEAETEIRLAEGTDASAKMRLTKQQDRLKELREDAEKLIVRAKKAGLVVYETRRHRWQAPVTVAVGEEIRPNQQLMIIPNMETLQVETRVYEAIREQVEVGQRALIRLDARPGRVIEGHIGKVAPLPNTQNPWLSPDVKVYPTVVKFKDNADLEGLKPGMSAEVEVILAELTDVLSVPIASVFAIGEATYCFRADGQGGYERVRVTLGRTSETRAQILEGLEAGERVLLAPPPGVRVGKKAKTEAEAGPPGPPTTAPATAPAGNERGRERERPGPERERTTPPATGEPSSRPARITMSP